MIQCGTHIRISPLILYSAMTLVLSYSFSVKAFVSPCQSHHTSLIQESRLRQSDRPMRLLSFPSDESVIVKTRNNIRNQRWMVPISDDEEGEPNSGEDGDKDWFKMGQEMAKELREEATTLEEDNDESDDADSDGGGDGDVDVDDESDGEEDIVDASDAGSVQKVAKEPATALLEAQVLSLETARALIASAACICQIKEEELKVVQEDIQKLREKLAKLEERKVLLEEECELARSNQDQTVEQELLIRGTFDKLSSRRDDMKKK